MKVQGMTDRSEFYRYTYDPKEVKRLFIHYLEQYKDKDVSRDLAIRSVHMNLSISYEEFSSRKSRRLGTISSSNTPDFSVERWVKNHYKREPEPEEKLKIVFISPKSNYLPKAISGNDLAECMEFLDEIIENGKNVALEETGDNSIIDDPIWCLWSDIYPTLAH